MILFVTKDSGPAKYLAYIAKRLDVNEYECFASNVSSEVFSEFGVKFTCEINDLSIKSISLIVTGTCLENGIDKEFIKIGRLNNIKTISIIEHWSLYKKRFELDEEYIFPDMIFLNDSLAREEALNAGINSELLHVVGNPVIENIKKNEYSDNDNIEWKNYHNINNARKIITFISESFKDDFHKDSLEFQGFDEFDVLNDILISLNKEDMLIVKLHPEENRDKYDFLRNNLNVLIIGSTDVKKLIAFSDILVGMGSMLLIEASITKINVYSYRPNEKIEFIGNKNGMVEKIDNIKELQDKLSNFNHDDAKSVTNNFNGSTDIIVNLIRQQA